MEQQTLEDLRNVSAHSHHGSSLQYYNAAVSAGVVPSVKGAALEGVRRAERRIAEICRLSQTIEQSIKAVREVPVATAPTAPPTVSDKLTPDDPSVGSALRDAEATADILEEIAAALWAQAEAIGIDPSATVARGAGSEAAK